MGSAPTTNNGNLNSQTITTPAFTSAQQNFTYNAYNRLLGAIEPGAWFQNYCYDQFGNRGATTSPVGVFRDDWSPNCYGGQFNSMIKFGFNSSDVDAVARGLGAHLEIAFDRHYSDFRGGEYCRSENLAGTLYVQANRDIDDPEPFEPAWPINCVVAYLDGLDDRAWDEIANKIRKASTELGATELALY